MEVLRFGYGASTPKAGTGSLNMSFSAYLAAWRPGIPVTPGPGGVEEEHR